ncbi:Type I secretion system ATP-binding protein PrsD [Vibrio stylophorae]|uniref:Type I secretion system ATP-binding protein PrsD n=1 Tax=Vibrio stylophorae TaxID=659351 RepID=A0ABM8ZU90_9VIBR|nr:type I secretion system permease/ATPase [Vibrio stylophorae]CAH0533518.1 Type I secretion system ATP-binding protein PrsD [Vibrio stylophorae]
MPDSSHAHFQRQKQKPNALTQQSSRFDQAMLLTKRHLGFVVLFSLVSNVLILTLPIYSLQLFDRVLTSASINTLVALCVIAVALLSLQAAFDYIRTSILQQSGLNLDAMIGPSILAQSVRQSAEKNHSDRQSMNALATLRQFFLSPSSTAIFDLPWTPIFLMVLFLLHPLIGAIALASIVLFTGLAFWTIHQQQKQSAAVELSQKQQQFASHDYLRHASMLRAMGMTESMVMRWQQDQQRLLQAQWQVHSKQSQLLALSRYLRTLLQIMVLSVGVLLVLEQQLGAGAIIASSILMSRVLAPFEQGVMSWRLSIQAYRAYQQLRHFVLNQDPMSKTHLPEPKGDICFEQVGLKFEGHQHAVLQGVNFKLGAGQALAIMGHSGAGKTLLVQLLMGIHQPTVGQIRIDGAAISQWPEAQFGQVIGYLPQHVGLLSGTVAENICRFTDAPAEKIVHAAQLACVHELILSLPCGYDTPIGEGGVQLSGGQLQRLALARAIFSNPRVLILDEPNSNLDPEGEVALAIVLQYCKEQGITVVMISHRPGFLKQMDWVLVLKDGRVEKAGTSEQFLGQQQAIRHHKKAKEVSHATS